MEQANEKELLFCDTFAHEGEEVSENYVWQLLSFHEACFSELERESSSFAQV